MGMRFAGALVGALVIVAAMMPGAANAALVIEEISPTVAVYTETQDSLSPIRRDNNLGPLVYDVTGFVKAVLSSPGILSFGCSASDFSGFSSGSIALVGRGACAFGLKAQLAEAAGASAIIFVNNIDNGTFNPFTGADIRVNIPTIGVSKRLGESWIPAASDGTLKLRLTAPPVPEPATWAMFIIGLGLIGGVMRQRKALTSVPLPA
jgi:hypothetical protein